jgi:uncharacterized protein YgbK (DUF1537 family)
VTASSGSLRALVRAERERAGRILAVLDDDPTGSQSVHDVEIVTVLERAEYDAALSGIAPTAFLLTNSRSLAEADAVALNTAIAADLHAVAGDRPLDVVSRSDSTLRGHVLAEVDALDRARRRAVGSGHDGVLFAPAFFEAGRTTADDVQWVRVGADRVPAGETEFARDATFGYRSSDLGDFLVEKSGGRIARGDVISISLTDIRDGGPDRVAEILTAVSGGAFVIVNGENDDDFDVVALGALRASAAGRSLLFRTGPSFVRALAGLEPGHPLEPAEIWSDSSGPDEGHGLVVVGSHVSGSSRQVEALRGLSGIVGLELEVDRVIGAADRRADHLDRLSRAVVAALAESDVLLFTSRALVTGADAGTSLEIARSVSSALSEVVARALAARPAWVVAKGGITSHDVAVHGLGIRRAEVVGQLGRGIISLFRPIAARPEAIGLPYVVFAGNVGDDQALANVVTTLRARPGIR